MWVESWDQWCQEGKDEVLRYRARVATLGRSLMQGGQNDEEGIKRLQGLIVKVAKAASSLMSRHGGRVEDVARQVGGALLAPHMDQQRIKGFFEDKCNVGGCTGRSSGRVRMGGDPRDEMAYGNRLSMQTYEGEVLRKAIADVAIRRAMVFKVEEVDRIERLRISPMRLMEETQKNWTVHDLTFEGPRSSASGGPRRSVKRRYSQGTVARMRVGWRIGSNHEANARSEGDVLSIYMDINTEGEREECIQASEGEHGRREEVRVPSRAISLIDFHLQFGWKENLGW